MQGGTSSRLSCSVVGVLLLNFCVRFAYAYPIRHETYQGYNDGLVGQRFSDVIGQQIPLKGRQDMRALIIGCGTGDFAEGMARDGFGYIHNIDKGIAQVRHTLSNMQAAKLPPSASVEEADLFDHVPEAAYDVIVDKGVLETIKDGHSKYLPHAWHMLKEEGLFIHIGPFAPKGNRDNGWSLGPGAPSSWLEDDQGKWRIERVSKVNNSKAWAENFDAFYVYFLRRQASQEL